MKRLTVTLELEVPDDQDPAEVFGLIQSVMEYDGISSLVENYGWKIISGSAVECK